MGILQRSHSLEVSIGIQVVFDLLVRVPLTNELKMSGWEYTFLDV